MKIFVTGGGMVGPAIVRALVSAAYTVHHFSESHGLMAVAHDRQATLLGGRYRDSLPWALSSITPDVIIHAAGPAGNARCHRYTHVAVEQHVTVSEVLTRWAKTSGASVIYLSTYLTHPDSLYVALKRAAECLIATAARSITLRLPHMYAPVLDPNRHGILEHFIRAALTDQPMRVNMDDWLQFLHVDDLGRLLATLVPQTNLSEYEHLYHVPGVGMSPLSLAMLVAGEYESLTQRTVKRFETHYGGITRTLSPTPNIARDVEWAPKEDLRTTVRGMLQSALEHRA